MPHPVPVPPAVERITSNPVTSRSDLVDLLHALLTPLAAAQSEGGARVRVGFSGTHFDTSAAELEGYARALWGLTPLLSIEPDRPEFADMRKSWARGMASGSDPKGEEYWGDSQDKDQRFVEMAALGFSLCLAPTVYWDPLTPDQKKNLNKWLLAANDYDFPENNWRYFRVFINLGLKSVGAEFSQQAIDDELEFMESFYGPDGLPADGVQPDCKGYDYYATSFAIPFYSLIYARLAGESDPERAKKYRARAQQNMPLAIHLFGTDGAAIPFGRSMTYRFACAAFWAGVAFDELELPQGFTWGIVKGLVLKNIRWFSQRESVFNRDGSLTIGWAYPQFFLSEDYNSPQSPYWALKSFLVLALPETHPFWAAQEEEYPAHFTKEPSYPVPAWGQVFSHAAGHDFMLSSGSYANHVQRADRAKYGKLAYSAQFGFSTATGAYGLRQLCPDSTLALSDDKDEVYWRVRRSCESVTVQSNGVIQSVWKPWDDVTVTTYLVPPQTTSTPYHTRLHRITSSRPLLAVDGGWAIHSHTGPNEHSERRLPSVSTIDEATDGKYESGAGSAVAISKAGVSGVIDLLGKGEAVVLDVEGSSNLVAPRTVIPAIRTEVSGETWLASRIWGIPAKGDRVSGWKADWEKETGGVGKKEVQDLIKELGVEV